MKAISKYAAIPAVNAIDWFTLLVRIAIIGYCGIQAADLGSTWMHGSAESLGGWMFLFWFIPALASFAMVKSAPLQPRWLAVAIVISCLGQLSWINALQHVALVIALAESLPASTAKKLWLASAVLWMPVCGYIVDGRLDGMETSIRLVGVIGSSALYFISHMPRTVVYAATSAASLLFPVVANADTFTYSPVQSPARPFGLDIVDQVGLAGSDEHSADFLNNVLPEMQTLINENLGERMSIRNNTSSNLNPLNPNSLKLSVASDARIYFVGEGAGYHNSLGFNTAGSGIDEGNPLLVFPDASSRNSYLGGGSPWAWRTRSMPLFPGDFVELGSLAVGTQLDFFLIANGAKGGRNVYSTNVAKNGDGFEHAVAFSMTSFGAAMSPYLLIGFEDLWGGGDEDYNDLLFAAYIGEQNVEALNRTASIHGVPAPEPNLIWVIVFGAGGWLMARARKKKLAAMQTVAA